MHTKDLARALRDFAKISDFDRSHELHSLAEFLERGPTETISARVKRASPSARYPLRLKETLETIRAGLRSVGAIKPSLAFSEILKLFVGRPDAGIEEFLSELTAPPHGVDINARRFKSSNSALADKICSELSSATSSPNSVQHRLEELSSTMPAGTATWTLVANRIIGNRRDYRDRKSALRAIKIYFDSFATYPEQAAEKADDAPNHRERHLAEET